MNNTQRLARLVLAGVTGVILLACTNTNHSADTPAPVFLTAEMTTGVADVDISVPIDVVIPSLTIRSQAKSPDAILGPQQDVYLSEWVVTCTRTDGGTKVSPAWHNFLPVYVSAGGNANLRNYRIFPSDYFKLAPLNQLFPENGGLDIETGKRNIRQRLRIELFGKTVAGDKVSVAIDLNLNFFYITP